MDWLRSRLPEELPGSFDDTHGWTTSWLLPCIAIAVIAAYAILARPGVAARLSEKARQTWQRALLGVLAVTALGAVVNYHDYGMFRYHTYHNEWNFYHYYLGTKYAHEIGYMDLYAATLIADQTEGLRYDNPEKKIRDLKTVEYRSVDEVLAEGDRYRDMFTPERWDEFVADVGWFREQLPPERWSLQLTDHGYNGTPVWTMVIGGGFTWWLSIRDPLQRAIMVSLDPILLITMFLTVAWSFGRRTALFMVIFLGTHYFMSWGHAKGSLVRTDYAVGLVLAVCLVHKDRYRLAGVCMAWAILSRVFPVMFLVGPFARLLWIGYAERRIDRRLLSFFVSCALTGLAFVLASLVIVGPDLWVQWIEKITEHYAGLIHWNVGYQAIADTEFSEGEPVLVDWAHRLFEEPDLALERTLTYWAVAAAVLLPAFVFCTALRDHEAICFGFVFMFFTVQAAYYYFYLLLVPFLFFASEVDRATRAIGAAFMLMTGMAGYLFFTGWDRMADVWAGFHGWHQGFGTTYYMSWLLCLTAVYMVALAGARARRVTP